MIVYLRQTIQNRGLTGRFNGIAVAGTVPLLGATSQLSFQCGLYDAPNLTNWEQTTNVVNNLAYAIPQAQPTQEINDSASFNSGGVTNSYWPVRSLGYRTVGQHAGRSVRLARPLKSGGWSAIRWHDLLADQQRCPEYSTVMGDSSRDTSVGRDGD